MTLSSLSSRIPYFGDGTTRLFTFPFRVFSASDLRVCVRDPGTTADRDLMPGVDFTVTLSPASGGADVFLASAPPAGAHLVIRREPSLTQELDLAPSGAFAAENIEAQLDRMVAQVQALRELLSRTPRLPASSPLVDPLLPEPSPQTANQVLAISAAGDRYDLRAPASLPLQATSSFIATLLDDPDAATARATLGIGATIDLGLLPADGTGGAHADFIPFTDASEGGASNRVTVAGFLSNAIAGAPSLAPADPSALEFMVRGTADGALHRVSLAQAGIGRQTVWIPAGAITPRLTSGAAPGILETPAARLMVRSLDFDPATPEYAQFSLQMPRAWNLGPVTALVVWSHAVAAGSFGVAWSLRALSLSDDDALDAPFGTPVQVIDTGGTAGDLYRSPETAPLVPAGTPATGDILVFEVMRAASDTADTLPVDARLHGITLFYSTNANTDN